MMGKSVVQRLVLALNLPSDGYLRCGTLRFIDESELCPGNRVVHVNHICIGSMLMHLCSLQSTRQTRRTEAYSVLVSSNPFCVFSSIVDVGLNCIYVP